MNKQSIASKKWQESAGLVLKGFKIKREIVEAFAKACEANGESQVSVISRLMQNYIAESKSTQ